MMGQFRALELSKHKFAVVCTNVSCCSAQISLGSISSFMRVCIYCWGDKVREYSLNIFLSENFMCKYNSRILQCYQD